MSNTFENIGIAVVSLAVGIVIGMKLKKNSEKSPEETTEKTTEKTKKIANFVAKNKEYVVAAVGGGIVLAKEAGRIIRDIRRTVEERSKKYRIYDHSTGKYIYLNREMTSYEHLIFDNRKRNGESASQILYDMGLLGR